MKANNTATFRCLAFVGPKGECVTVTDPRLKAELEAKFTPNAAGVVPFPSRRFPALVFLIQAWFSKNKAHRSGRFYLHAN